MINVSFIVPAFNEEKRIEETLHALSCLPVTKELIVVNDGSNDATEEKARKYADLLISTPINKGKGAALQLGWQQAHGTYIVCIDADLGKSAKKALQLLWPLEKGNADFTISNVKRGSGSGIGVVKRRAQTIIFKKTGVKIKAPLSGQRAFHRRFLPFLLKRPYYRFGVETQMTIDLLRAGAKCEEVEINFVHREMGRGLRGFSHRFKQWIEIEKQCREIG